jgi:hypothetical protein
MRAPIQFQLKLFEQRKSLTAKIETVSLTPDFEENHAFVRIQETCTADGCVTYIFNRSPESPTRNRTYRLHYDGQKFVGLRSFKRQSKSASVSNNRILLGTPVAIHL